MTEDLKAKNREWQIESIKHILELDLHESERLWLINVILKTDWWKT